LNLSVAVVDGLDFNDDLPACRHAFIPAKAGHTLDQYLSSQRGLRPQPINGCAHFSQNAASAAASSVVYQLAFSNYSKSGEH
jgi:hypothetical protein